MDYLWNGVLNHEKESCMICQDGTHNEDHLHTKGKKSMHFLLQSALSHDQNSCFMCTTQSACRNESSLKSGQNSSASFKRARKDPKKQKIAADKLIKILNTKLGLPEKGLTNKTKIKQEIVDDISEGAEDEATSHQKMSELPACLSFTSHSSKQVDEMEIPIEEVGETNSNCSEGTIVDGVGGAKEKDSSTGDESLPVALVQIEQIQSTEQPDSSNNKKSTTVSKTSKSTAKATGVKDSNDDCDEPMAVLKCHVCELCKEPIDDWNDYNVHKLICGLEFPCPCPTCGCIVPNKNGYMYHLEVHKKLTYNHKCENCNGTFLTNGTLRIHLRLKKPCSVSKTVCKFCGKLYKTEEEVNQHSPNCDMKKEKFQCEICSDLLGTRASLARHIQLVHEREKRMNDFICENCGKNFSSKSGLNKHMMKHMERKYKCYECGRMFIYFSNLKTHMTIHMKESKSGRLDNQRVNSIQDVAYNYSQLQTQNPQFYSPF